MEQQSRERSAPSRSGDTPNFSLIKLALPRAWAFALPARAESGLAHCDPPRPSMASTQLILARFIIYGYPHGRFNTSVRPKLVRFLAEVCINLLLPSRKRTRRHSRGRRRAGGIGKWEHRRHQPGALGSLPSEQPPAHCRPSNRGPSRVCRSCNPPRRENPKPTQTSFSLYPRCRARCLQRTLGLLVRWLGASDSPRS